jgi:RNA-directed DNA polymerase
MMVAIASRASHLNDIDAKYVSKTAAALRAAGSFDDDEISALLEYTNRLSRQGLPVIFDERHFAQLVGYDITLLFAISNSPHRFYRQFSIAKRGGGLRNITEPLPALKSISRWIQKNITDKLLYSKAAKAYIKGTGIKDNARLHKGQEKILKMDIYDFFHCCTSRKVFDILQEIGYSRRVSGLISSVVTVDGGLSVGSPASPGLANYILYEFDRNILNFCRTHKVRYTRYSDDMTFSGSFDHKIIIDYVENTLKKYAFRINSNKTKIMLQNNLQIVTGIVVNRKLNVRRSERRRLLQEAYYIDKYGINEHIERKKITRPVYLDYIRAKIGYCLWISPRNQRLKLAAEELKNIALAEKRRD